MSKQTIGQVIREMRKNKGWSMRKLAEHSTLSDSTVFRTERGMSEPMPETLRAVFAAFNPEVLATWEDDPEFYKEPAEGLSWPDPDEPVPSWIQWVEKPAKKGECSDATE